MYLSKIFGATFTQHFLGTYYWAAIGGKYDPKVHDEFVQWFNNFRVSFIALHFLFCSACNLT
jgi:hypothetical protein